jgi:CheY-like chemotaxis protein
MECESLKKEIVYAIEDLMSTTIKVADLGAGSINASVSPVHSLLPRRWKLPINGLSMKLLEDYVLVLDEQESRPPRAELSSLSDHCAFVMANSAEHAVEQAQQKKPCLVILVGENQSWFESQVRILRQARQAAPMTIVALTESASPRWRQDAFALDLDGFLVQPLTDDILVSLVQSAAIKQSYQ